MVNKEQKTALSFLIISKAFERLAFYSIFAIFIFYLTDNLKMSIDEAGGFYSTFYLSVGVSTLLFGFLGDFINRQKLVKIGMLLMTVFYLVLIFPPVSLFIQQAVFIALGICIGMTVPNTIVFLGNIYNERKMQILGLSGFIFFSLAIEFGAFIAPALSNAFREVIGYNSVFVLAFIFALISFVLYLFFDKKYSKLKLFAEQRKKTEPKFKNLNITILVSILVIGVILKMVLYQKDLSLNNYIRDFVANGHDLVSRLQNIDKRFSLLILIFFGIVIAKLKKLNWDILFKLIFIGSIISAIVYIFMAFNGNEAGEKMNSALMIGLYTILLLFEAIISVIIFYAIYRASPIRYKGLFQGLTLFIFFMTNKFLFVGSTIYEHVGSVTFIGFSLFFILGAVLILVLMKAVESKKKKLIEIEN